MKQEVIISCFVIHPFFQDFTFDITLDFELSQFWGYFSLRRNQVDERYKMSNQLTKRLGKNAWKS